MLRSAAPEHSAEPRTRRLVLPSVRLRRVLFSAAAVSLPTIWGLASWFAAIHYTLKLSRGPLLETRRPKRNPPRPLSHVMDPKVMPGGVSIGLCLQLATPPASSLSHGKFIPESRPLGSDHLSLTTFRPCFAEPISTSSVRRCRRTVCTGKYHELHDLITVGNRR